MNAREARDFCDVQSIAGSYLPRPVDLELVAERDLRDGSFRSTYFWSNEREWVPIEDERSMHWLARGQCRVRGAVFAAGLGRLVKMCSDERPKQQVTKVAGAWCVLDLEEPTDHWTRTTDVVFGRDISLLTSSSGVSVMYGAADL